MSNLSLVQLNSKRWITYALSRGSTGSSTTGLSTRSSLSFLTSGSGKSLNSSGSLGQRGKLFKTQVFHLDLFANIKQNLKWMGRWCISETYSLSLGTRLSLRARGANITLLTETCAFLFKMSGDQGSFKHWRSMCLETKTQSSHNQLSSYIVTLGTRGTNSSLSSSRTTSTGETRSTSNTGSTLWDGEPASQNTSCAGFKRDKCDRWMGYLQGYP